LWCLRKQSSSSAGQAVEEHIHFKHKNGNLHKVLQRPEQTQLSVSSAGNVESLECSIAKSSFDV